MTANVFRRVLWIKMGNDLGTAFTIEVDGRQYIVTAKHIFGEAAAEEATIEIRKNDSWSPMKVKVFRCDDPVDVAVLVAEKQLTVSFPLLPTTAGMVYGQDMYFLGYPYGIFTDIKGGNGPYPLPLIKKAVMAGSSGPHSEILRLDGYNNFGFSGGPVVFRPPGKDLQVAGVIYGFVPDYGPVLTPRPIRPQDVTPKDLAEGRILQNQGQLQRLTDTDERVAFNTGIVNAYNIDLAVDLIKKHPVGPKVDAAFTGLEEPKTVTAPHH